MPTLHAVTFDFWSTLVDGAVTPPRTARRMARLHAALVGAGHACSQDELTLAFARATERIDREARETAVEIGPPGRWAIVAEELRIPAELIPYAVIEKAYDDITLNPPPPLMPHVREAVDAMREAGFRLAVICNTGMAGGRTLREVLRHHGLLDCFAVTTFSDEVRVGKPHPAIFEQTLEALGGIEPRHALHVGDVEELDVDGARRAGVWSALYSPETSANDTRVTRADLLVRDWRSFGQQIHQFVTPGVLERRQHPHTCSN